MLTRRAPLQLLLVCVLAACTSTQPEPSILASTSVQGARYPQGSSATSPFVAPSRVAPSATYAYSPAEPVLVGSGRPSSGPQSERLYLSSLRGPNGEVITYERRGSCCPFETENSDLGSGMLDVYELTYEGLAEPLLIYINMYDPGEAFVPRGLSARQ